jgi:magnesium chelatase family protein
MDRIDIFVEVPPVEYEKLVNEEPGEDSAAVRRRIETAREVQQSRFKDCSFLCNSEMGPADV